MSGDILIGLDAGTSVIKAVAFSLKGEEIAVEARPNSYSTLDGSGVEQDMARTWQDAAASLRGLAAKVPDLAGRIAAIAVTGQGDGLWLIDGEGRPVAPALLWLDARAASVVDSLRHGPRGAAHYERTATGLAPCQQGAQLAWMQRHRPEVLAAATTAFHCKDWLYFNLTGARCTDPSEGLFTYGDFRTGAYSDEVIDSLGLAALRDLIPPIADGTRHCDRLTAAAAQEIGLPEGIPVVLGYVDVICAALGAGLYDRTIATGCTILGSTGMHMRLAHSAEDVRLNPARTGYTMAFPVPQCFSQMQSNLAATLNLDWLIDLGRDLGAANGGARSRGDLLAGLDNQVRAATPGRLIYHPYISEAGERGPFLDPSARASFIGLSIRTSYADMLRAVVEGLAFAGRECYAAMGPIPAEIRLTGGAARSAAIRSIMAAVLGAGVRASRRAEAGAAGAAMIAAVSLGLYPDMDACAADWVTPLLGAPEEPDDGLSSIYDTLYPAYVESRQALASTWHALAAR
jgi:erythritol kinase (D-erythritol 1-phosphate-forming)